MMNRNIPGEIILDKITKHFGEKQILRGYSAVLKAGNIYCLMAPSGGGKTTLLRIIAGLDREYGGKMEGLSECTVSMQFQEDRLLDHLSAADNIRFVLPGASAADIEKALSAVGLSGTDSQPVREYSGGMRRRVSLVRALLYPADLYLLDEPFTGLDEEARGCAIRFLKERTRGRTVLLTTHREQDAADCGASILRI